MVSHGCVLVASWALREVSAISGCPIHDSSVVGLPVPSFHSHDSSNLAKYVFGVS